MRCQRFRDAQKTSIYNARIGWKKGTSVLGKLGLGGGIELAAYGLIRHGLHRATFPRGEGLKPLFLGLALRRNSSCGDS